MSNVELPHRLAEEREPELSPAAQEARELLVDIDDHIDALVSLNMEHRVKDMWDTLPIIGSIRSHRLANKEAEIVEHLKSDVSRLEDLVHSGRVNLDIAPLTEAMASVSAPGGITKWIATIIPGLRILHRELTPQRGERLEHIVRQLKTQLREQYRNERQRVAQAR